MLLSITLMIIRVNVYANQGAYVRAHSGMLIRNWITGPEPGELVTERVPVCGSNRITGPKAGFPFSGDRPVFV